MLGFYVWSMKKIQWNYKNIWHENIQYLNSEKSDYEADKLVYVNKCKHFQK